MINEIEQYVQSVLEELSGYQVPGFSFPVVIIIGLLFLFLGARICKGLIAGICFLAGGAAGYYFSNENILIAIASGVGAGVIGFIVQYIVGVVLAGVAAGSVAVLAAFLTEQQHLWVFFAAGGFLVGALLAVRLYKILLIFATAALGAAFIAPTGLILLDEAQRPDMTQYVTIGDLNLDLYKFSVAFLALVAVGVIVQGIALVRRKLIKQPVQQA
jgi:hypothetical protein